MEEMREKWGLGQGPQSCLSVFAALQSRLAELGRAEGKARESTLFLMFVSGLRGPLH